MLPKHASRTVRAGIWAICAACVVACGAGCTGVSRVAGVPLREGDALADVRVLTRDFDDVAAGDFSPDLRWVAFQAVPRGGETHHVFVAPVLWDGLPGTRQGRIVGLGQPVQVTPDGSRNAYPTFSPDGLSLIFVSTAHAADDPLRQPDPLAPDAARRPPDYDAMAELYRVDNWQRNIAAADPRRGVDLTQYTLTRNRVFDGEPAWSPDGNLVAFASARDAPRSTLVTHALTEVYVMSADGSGVLRVTRGQGYDGWPAFSPDGQALFFHSERGADFGNSDVWSANLQYGEGGYPVAAGNFRRLTRGGARQPAVHPDGDVVVYVTDRHDPRQAGRTQLRQIRPDGSRDRRLTFDLGDERAPRFSRDGRWLLYVAGTGDNRQLHVARYVRPRRS